MRYKNEAGQSELALRHLGWSLLSERSFHIKARQMFKILHDLAPVRLSNIFIGTRSQLTVIIQGMLIISWPFHCQRLNF